MSNPSKKKGTAAETKVVKYLNELGIDAKRKALTGNKDEGDIEFSTKLGNSIILEVKTGKMTANYNRAKLIEWLRQTRIEQENSGATAAYLVIVRYGRKIDDAEVWWRNDNGKHMMYLDEFRLKYCR